LDILEVKITPSIYRIIDEAFRERLVDFEKKIATMIQKKNMDEKEVIEFLEKEDPFEEFDKLFNKK
jgi:hypothetical protein